MRIQWIADVQESRNSRTRRVRFGLLQMKQVARVGEHLDARTLNVAGEVAAYRGAAMWSFSPEDEGLRSNAMNTLLQPFVGNGPDELSDTGLSPREGGHCSARASRSSGTAKKCPCRLTVWSGEQRLATLRLRNDQPVAHGRVVRHIGR